MGSTYIRACGFAMAIVITGSAPVVGTGHDPVSENVQRTFVLRDGRIRDGLLTATKVYSNGERESFEGAFLDRTTSESASDKGVTVFGLGSLTQPMMMFGQTIDRLFYQRVP